MKELMIKYPKLKLQPHKADKYEKLETWFSKYTNCIIPNWIGLTRMKR